VNQGKLPLVKILVPPSTDAASSAELSLHPIQRGGSYFYAVCDLVAGFASLTTDVAKAGLKDVGPEMKTLATKGEADFLEDSGVLQASALLVWSH